MYKGLNQFYGGSHTLWDVDLTVPAGSRMCLMGRNGMGKTTLLKCIMGLQPVSSGSITVRRERFAQTPRRAARQAGHRLRAAGTRDFFAADGGGKSARRPGRAQERPPHHSAPDLRPVSRAEEDDEPAWRRSFRRAAAATRDRPRAGAEPKLLILDEPTEGIQPNIVHEIGDIVLKLNQEEGLTVLLVEQKLPFARRVASEFCILDKGRRVAAGPIGELTDEVVREHLSV